MPTYGSYDLARRRKLLLYGTIGVPPRVKPAVIKRRPGAQQSKLKSAWKSHIGKKMKIQMKKIGAVKSWSTPVGKKFVKLLKK